MIREHDISKTLKALDQSQICPTDQSELIVLLGRRGFIETETKLMFQFMSAFAAFFSLFEMLIIFNYDLASQFNELSCG